MNEPVICLRIDFRSAAWALLAACSFLMSSNLPAQDGPAPVLIDYDAGQPASE
jgi:hypothetical protein